MIEKNIQSLYLCALILFVIGSCFMVIGMIYERKNKNKYYLEKELEREKRNIEWPIKKDNNE